MNVLVPDTEPQIRQALAAAGFAECECVMKWNTFTTFVARKAAGPAPAPPAPPSPCVPAALRRLMERDPPDLRGALGPTAAEALDRVRQRVLLPVPFCLSLNRGGGGGDYVLVRIPSGDRSAGIPPPLGPASDWVGRGQHSPGVSACGILFAIHP